MDAVTQFRRTVWGLDWLRLCFARLCPGWEISAFQSNDKPPQSRNACEVRVQTFQAELRLDPACHYRCWPAVGSVWYAGGVFWWKKTQQLDSKELTSITSFTPLEWFKISYQVVISFGRLGRIFFIVSHSDMFWSKRGFCAAKHWFVLLEHLTDSNTWKLLHYSQFLFIEVRAHSVLFVVENVFFLLISAVLS